MPAVVLSARDDTVDFAGPLLIGHLINMSCYGILSTQVYMYHLAFPKDKRRVKAVVYTLYALETLQTGLLIESAYRAFAGHYGDVQILFGVFIDGFSIPIMGGIVSSIVQIYYAHRITILSGSRLLGCVVASLAIVELTASIIVGVRLQMLQTVADFALAAPISASIWPGASALCDAIIAVSTTWLLLKADAQFPATKVRITRVIRIVVETGTLTALVATTNMVLFFTFPHAGFYVCGVLFIPKLYSVSLLVLLNSRMRIVGARDALVCADTWLAHASGDGDGDGSGGEAVGLAARARRIGPFTSASQLGAVAVCEFPPLPEERGVGGLVRPPRVLRWEHGKADALQDARKMPDDALSSASTASMNMKGSSSVQSNDEDP